MSGPTEQGLDRFLIAQQRDYAQALAELQAGHKRSHWIWYVLPQLRSLGRSAMAREYGIRDRQEAQRRTGVARTVAVAWLVAQAALQ
jgi:uncharacterized protein (DUF1810 family)